MVSRDAQRAAPRYKGDVTVGALPPREVPGSTRAGGCRRLVQIRGVVLSFFFWSYVKGNFAMCYWELPASTSSLYIESKFA